MYTQTQAAVAVLISFVSLYNYYKSVFYFLKILYFLTDLLYHIQLFTRRYWISLLMLMKRCERYVLLIFTKKRENVLKQSLESHRQFFNWEFHVFHENFVAIGSTCIYSMKLEGFV